MIDASFPARTPGEKHQRRRVRLSVQKFAASTRARRVAEMNRWAAQADAEIVEYWNRRGTK